MKELVLTVEGYMPGNACINAVQHMHKIVGISIAMYEI